ncbi:hypothetical protein [Paenibacillus sp. 481]|uniref:hypothetical protein n=1 Tax=Paenibacillus sp. 481 TaxID=2835869 RepID=UPI001E475036|nr:hypothetical protein [Paenibacillus sp. 481]UHA73434.1 hypothetical protein KIK04_23215 [Paenibacillus sp. 481]
MLERRAVYNGFMQGVTVVTICFLLLVATPAYAAASNTEWDAALTTIEQLHDSFSALELANTQEKQKVQTLREQNSKKHKEISMNIQLIDKAKLDKLKLEADHVQTKYAPLLAKYTELGKKATEAKKRKDNKSALVLDLQRNRIKASAQTARKEIKLRKDALTAARKQASAKAKMVRHTLVPMQTLKKQITAEHKKITELNKHKVAANKRYAAAIKQGDALTAAGQLKQIVGKLHFILASQKKVYEWEGNIRGIIHAAQSKL